MTLLAATIIGAVFVAGMILGALIANVLNSKKGYTEVQTLRVGWCVIDDDDAVLGYAKGPDDYAAIMAGKDYATAHPMFIKLDD